LLAYPILDSPPMPAGDDVDDDDQASQDESTGESGPTG
jgi:hypothetical protein